MITKKTAQIAGPIGEIYGRDPLQFVLAYTRKNANRISDLLHRVARRTGVTQWTVDAPGGGTYNADMVPNSDDDNVDLAVKFMLWLTKNPEVVKDEIRRKSFGLPYGIDGDQTQESTGGSNSDSFDFNAAVELAGKGADILGGLLGMSGAREKPPANGETVTVTKAKQPPWLLIALGGVVALFVLKKV